MLALLTRAEVERIAALAHLELADDEIDLFVRQLGDILDTPTSSNRSTPPACRRRRA